MRAKRWKPTQRTLGECNRDGEEVSGVTVAGGHGDKGSCSVASQWEAPGCLLPGRGQETRDEVLL